MKSRPKHGDKADRRCAFILDRVVSNNHDLGEKPSMSWCYGCGFYVCDECAQDAGLTGKHSVLDHVEPE